MRVRECLVLLSVLAMVSACEPAPTATPVPAVPAARVATATPLPPTATPEAVTPTPEVFIPRTAVVSEQAIISGRVSYGGEPVAGATVELRTGAWADRNAAETIAQTVSDADGTFELEAPPAGGQFGLVALWPDGAPNTATVIPVDVDAGATVTDVEIFMARELEMIEPVSGAEVGLTPDIRWIADPAATTYRFMLIDAGTTEVVLDLVATDVRGVGEVVAPPLTPGHTYTLAIRGLVGDPEDTWIRNNVAGVTLEFRVKSAEALALPTPSCVTNLERRELREPYHRDSGQSRYTLSEAELQEYLALMGIDSVCLPFSLGAPFVNADWNSAEVAATTGRMVSLGLEGTYTGAGWSQAFLLYSTYDFATGSMYDVFARPEDRDAVRDGTMDGTIEVDGVKGVVRFKPGDHAMGTRTMYMTYVFPFETSYVAVVYYLGDYDTETDWDALIEDLQRGAYPPHLQATVAQVDALVASLRFAPTPDAATAN